MTLKVGDVRIWMLLFRICYYHVIVNFWREILHIMQTVLKQTIIFIDTYAILNYLAVTWRLTSSQRKWTLCALTSQRSYFIERNEAHQSVPNG